MFTALQLKERMKQNPFKPFRVHLSDGKSFDISNHDMAWVKQNALEIGLNQDENLIPGRTVECAIIHITRIEEIAPARAA